MTIIDHVKALAEEYPDAIYELPPGGCLYTVGKCGPGTGCIVGQAIARMFPDRTDLMAVKDEVAQGSRNFCNKIGVSFTDDEHRWLCNVQGKQDRQFTWADAVKHADLNTY